MVMLHSFECDASTAFVGVWRLGIRKADNSIEQLQSTNILCIHRSMASSARHNEYILKLGCVMLSAMMVAMKAKDIFCNENNGLQIGEYPIQRETKKSKMFNLTKVSGNVELSNQNGSTKSVNLRTLLQRQSTKLSFKLSLHFADNAFCC